MEDQLASAAKSPYWRGLSAARRVCRERQIGIEGKLAGATGSASADCSTPHLTAGLEQTCTVSITANCKTMELAPPHLPVAALKLHHDVRMLI